MPGHALHAVKRFFIAYGYFFMFGLSGIVVAVWMGWSSSTPASRQYLDQTPKQTVLSPLSLICRAHSTIARLQPSSSDTTTTLFSVLRLDPTEPPFYPADSCAYPYRANYQEAKAKITEAWAEVTDKHHGQMREWRDAFALAATVLLDDTSRTVYMKEVLPELQAKGKGNAERGWEELCEKMGFK